MPHPALRSAIRLLPWLLLYLLVGAALALPADPRTLLAGHPGVDVYNHAWGVFWWAWSLDQGELPWRTSLLLHPRGGVLFHIDPVGALTALPVALAGAAGPAATALGYNLSVLLRFALAGLGAHLLARELSGRDGPHAAVAGLAHMTAPYLLCEQYNGITEATSTGAVALALWGWARATRRRSLGAALLAGLLTGFAAVNSFYFGLALALTLGPALLLAALRGRLRLRHLLPGGLLALLLSLPVYLLFRASFLSPEAALPRGGHQNLALILHNAVDPRELLLPGVRSFDFAAQGELFLHSLYLRASLLLLALVGLWRRRDDRLTWLWLALAPLVLALGPYLVWEGALVRLGEGVVGLPFLLLQKAVPELAITHAARLGVVGVAVLCGLGGAALATASKGRAWLLALPAAALLVAEGLWASPVRPPLPAARADIPPLVAQLAATDLQDRRGVLDLPPQVDRAMWTSRYLWYQVGHRRPIPYAIDPHIQRSGDNDVLLSLERHTRGEQDAQTWSLARLRTAIPQRYAWLIVHEDLERHGRGHDPRRTPAYTTLATELFGAPTLDDGERKAWALR